MREGCKDRETPFGAPLARDDDEDKHMVPTPAVTTATSLLQNIVDRRRNLRARLAVPVTLTVDGHLIDAVGADVSTGGMRFVAMRAPKVGSDVSLVFFLDGDIIAARGCVQWHSPTRNGLATFGVRFTSLEDDAPMLLAGYCRSALS